MWKKGMRCAAFLVLFAGRDVAAQQTGAISGSVVDESDQFVPGATVTLVDNALNHLQFSDIDRNVRFDAAGNQVNANFGKARSSRQPRVIQLSIRLNY